MKVKATNKYKELKLKAVELGRIPKEGEIFEIKNEKFSMLNGNNKYKAIFVEKLNENKEQTNEVDKILNGKNPKGKNK